MSGAFDTHLEALRSYEAKLRTSVEELQAAFVAARGVDLTRLPDESAGRFAESAAFVAGYRSAAGQLWPDAVATLRALDNAARTLGGALDRYAEQEESVAETLRAIGDVLRRPE